MTKANITEYDNTAANNTDVQDVPLGENAMYPSHVNNAFREIMADLADVNDGTVALTSPSAGSINVTGNITVGGTVDGRDVAADGTKLDGVETGATADQTGAEIKTAYEGNADTNAFTDAEQTKLSGIETSADVTDTANVTSAGAAMLTGATFTGSITAPDATVTGDLTVDTDTLYVDSTNDRVGVGTLVPSATFEVESTDALLARFSGGSTTAGTKYIQVVNTSDDTAGLNLIHHSDDTASVINQANAALKFGTNDTERMRIDSDGDVLIGSSTNVGTGDHKVSVDIGTAGRALGLSSTTTTTKILASFINSNGTVGSIRTSGSATSYVTSSDYRLKENAVDISDGITRVKQLQPKRFNFIADDSTTVDGFMAHEAQTVVPEAVTGTQDAVDDDGNPDYQGIDQSKLVPLLTAALKEAITKIETLETKVAALEASD